MLFIYLQYSSISGDIQLHQLVSHKEFYACQFAQTMRTIQDIALRVLKQIQRLNTR